MIATCIHCGGDCRITSGEEIYPHRPDLHHKPIWKCDPCDARVGCHQEDPSRPLGFAANAELRKARMMLHNMKLDPLWKGQETRRGDVYKFLANALGIKKEDCHTGHFDLERCRAAWVALKDQSPQSISAWAEARRINAKEDRSDRKRRKHGRRGRRQSADINITGPMFCPKQASLNEIPW